MSGDWIKIQHVTQDKPEIVTIADILGIDQDAAFGKIMRIWVWADQQSIEGYALSVTKAFLNRLTNCSGFADAMIKTGWLLEKDGLFTFPNFDRHNGNSAKKRALSKDRMEKHRYAPSVTKASPEKRREEVKIYRTFQKPTLEELRNHIAEKGYHVDPMAWLAHYETNGWKVGKNPMKNWKSSLYTWEKGSTGKKERVFA